MLAYRLKHNIKEVEQMTINEFMEWVAFFQLHDKANQSQMIKSNGKFS